jgi:hypothetical protein
MIGFTFPFSDTAIDWCPNPFLNNMSFQAQGRQLGGVTWDSTKPNLLQQTGSALTEPQTQGLNDELVSSYANPETLLQDASWTPGPQWAAMWRNFDTYFGTDWMACFDCQPSYCFMKGLNSEGTPKVM